MNIPLELICRNIENKEEIELLIHNEVSKLEAICDTIMRCRIVVEEYKKHPQGSNPYSVKIDMTIPPNHEIVVKKTPTKDDAYSSLTPVIHDAFDAAERQIQKIVDCRQPKQRERRKKELPVAEVEE